MLKLGEMKRFYVILAIGVLALLTIGLVLVFAVKRDKTPVGDKENRATFENQPATFETSNSQNKPPWLGSLTPEQQKLFEPPASSASDDDKRAYSLILSQNAKKAQLIDIYGQCRPSPLVLLESEDLNIKIRNRDSVSHEINLGQGERHILEPGKIADLKIREDNKGKGMSYGCDKVGRAGFIFVVFE